MDLDLGAAAPYGSEAGAGRSVCSRRGRFRRLERRNSREMRRALALGGRRLGSLNNNQPDSRIKR